MNVTPLVDVVLVLLIIFMVVAPRLDQDIPVTLPGVFHPDPDAEANAPPITVTIKNAGEYYFDGESFDRERLYTTLTKAHAAQPVRRLELRADASLKYREIRGLYNFAHEIGFPGVSFLVTQRHGDDTPWQ